MPSRLNRRARQSNSQKARPGQSFRLEVTPSKLTLRLDRLLKAHSTNALIFGLFQRFAEVERSLPSREVARRLNLLGAARTLCPAALSKVSCMFGSL